MCDISKGLSGGMNRVLLTLQPGSTTVESWNFKDCLDGKGLSEPIHNFTLWVTQPRAKNGALRFLPNNTPLECVVNGVREPTGVISLGTVTNLTINLTMRYSGKSPLDIELSTTCVMGA